MSLLTFLLAALRYLFLLLLVFFLYRLVKWMVGDLRLMAEDSPGQPAVPPEEPLRLVVLQSSLPEILPGSSFEVGREVTLGRSAGNTIPIADSFVSQYHARVRNDGGRFWLEDFGSTNGTLLNGERIKKPVALKEEDSISVGGVTFQLVRCGHEVGRNN